MKHHFRIPLDEAVSTGSVPPPESADIVYLFFLFFFTILILNLVFSMDLKDRSFKTRKALYLSFGSFAFLIAVLSPDIFIYNFSGVHHENALEGILLNTGIFAVLFSGLTYVLMYLREKERYKYLNVLFLVTGNSLWLMALTVIGRIWYWAPREQGYFGAFYFSVLFYYLPVVLILLLLKILSFKLLETYNTGGENNEKNETAKS
ncbi:MAG: hypothetical protein LWY06_10730 [Firmicutes bacterium]|nr:hypothetical protein [Bacillota bacterium]